MTKSAKPRDVRIEGEIVYVPLTRGYEAVVDLSDLIAVSGFNWRVEIQRKSNGAIRCAYASRSVLCADGKWKRIWMHRLLLNPVDGEMVDHIDCNGLNNRRSNLRIADVYQNQRNRRLNINNSSGFKGVSWQKRSKKWHAYIKAGGKRVHLGYFSCVKEAAKAYEDASKAHHGTYGRLS